MSTTFCTVKDVRDALTSGADENDTETAASFEDWQIDNAIAEAEGIIRAHIATRYLVVPLEIEDATDPLNVQVWLVAPSPIRWWARDIAAFLVDLTYMKHKDVGEDDPSRLRYNLALTSLVAIRDRKMDLPTSDFPTSVSMDDQGAFVINQYEGSLFAMEDVGICPELATVPNVLWPRGHW